MKFVTKDEFDIQYEEHLKKIQKKQQKLERLHQKNKLIQEIKSHMDKDPIQMKKDEQGPKKFEFTKGSYNWALNLLGADKDFGLNEIRKNYFTLAQKFHPDKNEGQETEEMQNLNEAWNIIKIQFR